jgi:quinol monooxygenase YgiN
MTNRVKIGRAALLVGLVAGAAVLGAAQADEVTPLHYLNIQTINPEAREAFLVGMRHNATESRKEAANIVFDVADVGGGDPTLVLFESWRDRTGYIQHEASAHVAPVIALVPKAFAKPERKYLLQDVAGLPTPVRKAITDPSSTVNLVTRLTVKAGARPQFIDAIGPVVKESRSAEGNLVFNLYEDRSDSNSFVLYERWVNAATYDAHLARPDVSRFDGQLESMSAQAPEIIRLRDRITE